MRLSTVAAALSFATSALALIVPQRVRADVTAPEPSNTDFWVYQTDATGHPTFFVTDLPLGEVGACPNTIPLSSRTTLEDTGVPAAPEVAFVGELPDGTFAFRYVYTDEVGERGIAPARVVLMALQKFKSESAMVPGDLEKFLATMGDGWVSMRPSRENKTKQLWGPCELGHGVKEQCAAGVEQVTATLLYQCGPVQDWGEVKFPDGK